MKDKIYREVVKVFLKKDYGNIETLIAIMHTLSCKVLCHPGRAWRTYSGWWSYANNCACRCRSTCRVSRSLLTWKCSTRVFPYHPERLNVCRPMIVESNSPLSMSAENFKIWSNPVYILSISIYKSFTNYYYIILFYSLLINYYCFRIITCNKNSFSCFFWRQLMCV